MSLSAIAPYPNDKGSEMYSQGTDDLSSDFFDQFINFNSLEGGTPDYSILPESMYMETRSNYSGCSSLSTEDERNPRLWTGESWIFPEHISTQPRESKQFYTELSGRAAISDSELLGLEGITLKAPQGRANSQLSLPSSPSTTVGIEKQRKKSCIVATLQKTFKKAHKMNDKSSLRTPIRKMNDSPKMGRLQKNEHCGLEVWKSKIGNDSPILTFEPSQDNLPLSSSHSAKVSEASINLKKANGRELNGFGNRITSTHSIGLTAGYYTPARTQRLDSQQTQQTPNLHRSDNAALASIDQPHHNGTQWTATTVYPGDIEAPIWWSHAASTPMAQPSPNLLPNHSQRKSKTLAVQLQNDVAYHNSGNEVGSSHMNMGMRINARGGLMIQMPSNSIQQSYIMSAPPMIHQERECFPPQRRSAGRAPRAQQQSSPRKHRTPSLSSDSASPSSPSLRVRKRRIAKNLNERSAGVVDFVNFTPDDSRKILTGVAPSGSSKTKARREKEAEEKRRKLSQAALRAVRAAGGDVESLVEEGLFA